MAERMTLGQAGGGHVFSRAQMVVGQVDINFGQVLSPVGVMGAILTALTGIAPVVGVVGGLVAMGYYITCWWNFPEVKQWRAARRDRRRAKRLAKLERMHAAIVQELAAHGVLQHANITIDKTNGDTTKFTRTVESTMPKDKS